jgi:PilZ domain
MIATRQRRKKGNRLALILVALAVVVIGIALAWTPARAVFMDGPLKPIGDVKSESHNARWRNDRGTSSATIQRPAEIRTLDSYLGARQRAGVRVQLTLAVRWRFMGNGLVGEYRAGTVNDLSRNGMQMTSDFALTIGDQIDVGLPVRKDGSVVTVIGVVRRVEKLSSGKTLAGVELLRVAPNLEAEIVGFLNRRQIDLRKRGLA